MKSDYLESWQHPPPHFFLCLTAVPLIAHNAQHFCVPILGVTSANTVLMGPLNPDSASITSGADLMLDLVPVYLPDVLVLKLAIHSGRFLAELPFPRDATLGCATLYWDNPYRLAI